MSELELPAVPPVEHTPVTDSTACADVVVPVDPVRAAAGRLGAQRLQALIQFGKDYEREHDLTPGRQRLRQLVQLGRRYELEHGLRAASPRRRTRGDAWADFLAALARVVKPAHRPAVENLVTALKGGTGD